MQVVHPICCGIDVHQTQLTACLRRVDADGQVTQEVREFATRPHPSEGQFFGQIGLNIAKVL
jgi:hypothetical protein